MVRLPPPKTPDPFLVCEEAAKVAPLYQRPEGATTSGQR
jgi:hypothetical protein